MRKERCGSCPDCESADPVWCFQWGEPSEQDLLAMTDEQFGRVSRMMKGHHGTVDDTVQPDPPSSGGSMAPDVYVPQELTGQVPALSPPPERSRYEERKLPPVAPPPARAEHSEQFEFSIIMDCLVSGDRQSAGTARNVEAKREAIQRDLRMIFHDPSIKVKVNPLGSKVR